MTPRVDHRFDPKLPVFRERKSLCRRETEVARMVHAEYQDKEIAYLLGISTHMVKVYAFRARRKLGIRSRVGLALWWERKASRGISVPVQ